MNCYYFPKIYRSAERQHSMNIRTEKILNEAQSGDVNGLKNYLKEELLFINEANYYGRTALHLAAENGNLTALTTLIKAGAYVNISTSTRHIHTPVMMASSGGHLSCLQALIKAGARLDNLDQNGIPPLLLARNLQCFHALIEGGACVNQRTWNGAPIITLVSNEEEIQALLKAGADVHLTDKDGKTVLMYDTEIHFTKRLLSLGLNPNTQDNNGKTALMHACEYNSEYKYERVSILLQAGADVSITDNSGDTALMMAAKARSSDIVKALLEAKADANIQDRHGKTALMYAQDEDCVKSLFCLGGANLNMRDHNGTTALMFACGARRKVVLKDLLESGADVGITDNSGLTALMMAAKDGNSGKCKVLLEAKADPNKQDNKGITALMYASSTNIQFQYLQNDSHPLAVQALLGAGADVDITDHSGRTALMIAAENESSDIVEKLLQGKADPNKKDRDGKTALMYARNAKCIKVLISHGANVNLTDKSQCRALDYKLHDLTNHCDNVHSSSCVGSSCVIVLLKEGSYPVINAKYRPLFLSKQAKYHLLCLSDIDMFGYEISNDRKQVIRFVVCNGIVDPYLTEKKHFAQRALQNGQVDVLKYLIANCYLTLEDLTDMISRLGSSQDMEIDVIEELLMNAFRQPWPLEKLAFIAVSSALGPSPGREARIPKTGLPATIQRMLLFQEPVSRLPVSEWDDIPLWFDQ